MEFAPSHPVPVFPLPGLVLFPGTAAPLHVFELRYRTMVRDALSGGRMIALALLRPGWERDDRAAQTFFSLGCLARFEEVRWLVNDCYDLTVLGLSRIRFGRLASEFPYRAARVSLLPQAPVSEDDPLIQVERRALLEAYQRLVRRAEMNEVELPVVEAELAFEPLVNHVCMGIPCTPAERLGLLELDDLPERAHRARTLIERLLGPGGLRAGRGD